MMDDDKLAQGTHWGHGNVAMDMDPLALHDPLETDGVLTLLKDYTEKLNITRIRRSREELFVFLFFDMFPWVLCFVLLLLAALFFDQTTNSVVVFFVVAPMAPLIAGATSIMLNRKYSRSKGEAYDKQLTHSLERLVRLASQALEYSHLSFAKKLEIELRLAEAEAALRSYTDMAGKKRA